MKTWKFFIFGLGAIGSNLIMQLSRIYGDCSFFGIDFDKVEERNIDTQAYFLHHINLPKAQAMSVIFGLKSRSVLYTPIIAKIETEAEVEAMIPNDSSIIIDCFDNAESRALIHGKNCLHVGFSPQYSAEIIWDERYSTPNNIPPEQNDVCEMSEAVPFINLVVSLACMNINNFIDSGIKNDIIVTNKSTIKRL